MPAICVAVVWRSGNMISMKKAELEEFVLSHQTENGGFVFCNPLPASTPETFYAIYILKNLGLDIPKENRVINYIEERIRNARSSISIYYLLKSNEILEFNLKNRDTLKEHLIKKLNGVMKRKVSKVSYEMGVTSTYSFELPSLLEEIFSISESLRILNFSIEDDIYSSVERLINGQQSSENLKNAYYIISVMKDRNDMNEVLHSIKKYEAPKGGYSKTLGSFPPYLEDTFYALSSFDIAGQKIKNEKTSSFILKLQNKDGGFRRSLYGGISTLEDSYYAIASLRIIGNV